MKPQPAEAALRFDTAVPLWHDPTTGHNDGSPLAPPRAHRFPSRRTAEGLYGLPVSAIRTGHRRARSADYSGHTAIPGRVLIVLDGSDELSSEERIPVDATGPQSQALTVMAGGERTHAPLPLAHSIATTGGPGESAPTSPRVGGVQLSPGEQHRRQRLLQDMLAQEQLDALVLVANDHRGHKGSLRWATDYNLAHRHGFAFVAPGREPELVLPQNMAHGAATQGWSTPVRYARRAAQGVANAVAELPVRDRVGIVGLGEIMRVADAELLRRALPSTRFIDVSAAFERLRAQKSEEELAGVRESTYIAERCFARLLEVTRPGITEREVGAEMYRTMYLLGGEDPLFLSMSAERMPDGTSVPRWAAPRDRVLHVGDQFIFSFELIGRLGYWMEFARPVVLGTPTDEQVRLSRAVADGMRAAAERTLPGATPASVQRGILDAVERHGAVSIYWSGHGLGQDVIEEPWIGREVVDADEAEDLELDERMVLAMHPMVSDRRSGGMSYMANSYIVTGDGGQPVSQIPLDIHVL
jgi:Xaa-Pro dipeptidase